MVAEGPADLLACQAADRAQRERDLGLLGERWVAAGEHQAQQLVVGPPIRSPGLGRVAATGRPKAIRAGRGVRDREERELLRADPVAAEPVEGLAAGGGGQPAARVLRHPVAGPVLDGLDKGVLHRVLRETDVTGPRRERGPNPGRLLPVSALEWLPRVHAPSLPRARQMRVWARSYTA
jgi:hypothetical protein